MRYLPQNLFTVEVGSTATRTFPQWFDVPVNAVESNWCEALQVTVQAYQGTHQLFGATVYDKGNFRYRSTHAVDGIRVVELSGQNVPTFTEVTVVENINYADRPYLYDTQQGLVEQIETNNQTIIVPTQRWG